MASHELAPLGWNTTSNARHEVKMRDYLDSLRAEIGVEIEAQVKTGRCGRDYYGLGAIVTELPHVKSLIEFMAERMREPVTNITSPTHGG